MQIFQQCLRHHHHDNIVATDQSCPNIGLNCQVVPPPPPAINTISFDDGKSLSIELPKNTAEYSLPLGSYVGPPQYRSTFQTRCLLVQPDMLFE